MANQKDLDFTYSTIDDIFRLSMGETGDFSGAMYNGDFNLTLEEAQRAKHKFIADSLKIEKGTRVIDLGCGWGPFLAYATHVRKADAMGLTLSKAQAEACRKNNLRVDIRDCRKVKPEDYGKFDAVVSVGAFEHFCSVEDWQSGKQEAIYSDFFKHVFDLLPKGGRFYLQTMVFGKNMVDWDEIDINKEKGSAAHVCALMVKEFPGSWLPYGLEMVVNCAEPYFSLISESSGRLDYIETIGQWRRRFRAFGLKKYLLYLSLLPNYLSDKEFRHRVEIFRLSPNRICFEKQIMDHHRIVFEKR